MSSRLKLLLLTTAAGVSLAAAPAFAAPMMCTFSGTAQSGLAAAADGDDLVVTWEGDPGNQLRMRLAVNNGAPTIKDLAIKAGAGDWTSVASNATPDFQVTTGLRRMSYQQLEPLYGMGVKITQDVLNKYRWDPFWDAPLDLEPAPARDGGNPPPKAGLPGTDQPGLPRDPKEITRSNAIYAVSGCDVKSSGGRIEISLPGVKLGAFDGKLMYTVYKGTNLIRQEVDATTMQNWVAYKYDAGLKGLAITPNAKVAWKDTGGFWQTNALGGGRNADKVPLKAANRLAMATQGAGSIAAFPPPHKFFWSREVAINMGYNWYRKDSPTTYGFGIRQNDHEDLSEGQQNWALYSARPGTEQLMPVYFYPSLNGAEQTATKALAFTHGDTYKPLAGYKVMNHHYHMDLGQRLIDDGPDALLPDLQVIKSLGINIVSQIDSVMLRGFTNPLTPSSQQADPGPTPVAQPGQRPRIDQITITASAVNGARTHSDKDFLIMADQEVFGSPLGGHTDLLFSHPVYWDQRKPGQPMTEPSDKYGKVYHIGSADDFMVMAKAEDVMISMPHPRTKGSTGFPDAIKDREFFNDPHYVGVGVRWGMGIDGSERRTCEYRCLPLMDDMSNWVVDKNEPLKYVNSISEVRWQSPGDDVYGSSPVTYVKLDKLPPAADPSPVIKALMNGDSFITTGEVLISNYAVQEDVKNGKNSKVVADIDWTFPLDMVEIVWGDGVNTGRQVIPTADLPPFGTHHFEIPFDAKGKKWIRFAAWDSASEGAFTQPQRLSAGVAAQAATAAKEAKAAKSAKPAKK